MNSKIKLELSKWHFMRILRLGIGIYAGVEAFRSHEVMIGFLSAFFLYQAITDTGCGGASCVSRPSNYKDLDETNLENNQKEIK